MLDPLWPTQIQTTPVSVCRRWTRWNRPSRTACVWRDICSRSVVSRSESHLSVPLPSDGKRFTSAERCCRCSAGCRPSSSAPGWLWPHQTPDTQTPSPERERERERRKTSHTLSTWTQIRNWSSTEWAAVKWAEPAMLFFYLWDATGINNNSVEIKHRKS